MITLIDVAKAAGVSKTTASKALNGGGGKTTVVSAKTAQHVRETARRLGYRPSLIAQQLVNKRNNIIGVIIDSQCCLLMNNIMAEIEKRTFRAGLRLQVGLVHDSLESIRKYADDLTGYGIDNVIQLAHYYDFATEVPPLFRHFRNVLFINQPMGDAAASFIAPDYYGNFRLAVDHLLEQGRRRIIYAKTAYDTVDCHDRIRAMRDSYREHGVAFEEAFIFGEPLREIDTPELMERFLAGVMPLEPDAFLLGNQLAIMRCLNALQRDGVKVPEEIAIVGMDAFPGADACLPSITVIDNDYAGIAERAFQVILDNLDVDRPLPVRETVPGRLIIGDSSCASNDTKTSGTSKGGRK